MVGGVSVYRTLVTSTIISLFVSLVTLSCKEVDLALHRPLRNNLYRDMICLKYDIFIAVVAIR